MEAILGPLVPLALLWIGYALLTGQSLAPAAVIRQVFSLCWRVLRWLWQQRPPPGGPGRLQRPPIRYRR